MREHVDLPALRALQAQWRRNPPVHQLVAAYLEYKPPADDEDEDEDEAPDGAPTRRPAWADGMGGVPASPDLAGAQTTREALAAAERLFFGQVLDAPPNA